MISHSDISFELDQVRALYLRKRRRMAFARFVLYICAAFISLVIIDLFLHPDPIQRRFILLFAGIGIVASLANRYFRADRRPLTDSRLATYVEERISGFDESLITAASIDPQTLPPEERPLAQELAKQVIRKLACNHIEDAVDMRPARNALILAAFALFISTLVWVAFPGHAIRAAYPFRPPEAEPQYGQSLLPGPLSVNVTPKSLLVEMGTSADVTATFNRAPEIDPVLVFAPNGGEPRSTAMFFNIEASTYSGAIFGVDTDGLYRVVAGELSSSDYPIKVFVRPKLMSIRHVIKLPDYLKMLPKEVPGGNISTLAGSDIRFFMKFNKPLATCAVTPTWSPAPAVEMNGAEASFSFKLAESGTYSVLLADAEGYTNQDGDTFTVTAEKDKPPTISFIEPGGDVELALDRELLLRMEADDDYGVASLGLYYNINGAEDTYIDLTTAKGDIPPVHRVGTFTVSVESVGLNPGDVMTYYARADDANTLTGPGRSWTKRYFIFGMLPYIQGGAGAPSQGGKPPISLTSVQRRIILATATLAESEPTSTWDFDHRAIAKSEETLGETVSQIASAFEEAGDTDKASICYQVLNLFREIRTALLEKRASDALIPEQEALPLLYQIEPKVLTQGPSSSSGSSGGGSQGQQSQENQMSGEPSEAQEELFSQLKTAKAGEVTIPSEMRQPPPLSGQPQAMTPIEYAPEIVEAVRRMEELARREENMAGQEQPDAAQAAQEQQQMAQEASELAKKMKEMAAQNRSNAPLAAAASKLAEAAAAMQSAGQAAGQGQQGMSAAKSRAAAQAMREALAAVSRTSSQSVRERAREAAAEARNLAQRAKTLSEAEKKASQGGMQQTDSAINDYERQNLGADTAQFRESLEELSSAAKELAGSNAAPSEYAQAAEDALSRLPASMVGPTANRDAQAAALEQVAELLENAEGKGPAGNEAEKAARMVAELITSLEKSSDHAFGAPGSGRGEHANPEEAGQAIAAVMPTNVNAAVRSTAALLAGKLEASQKLPPEERADFLKAEALPLARELHSQLQAIARAAGRDTPTHSGFADEFPPEYTDAVNEYFRALATEGDDAAKQGTPQ